MDVSFAPPGEEDDPVARAAEIARKLALSTNTKTKPNYDNTNMGGGAGTWQQFGYPGFNP